MQAAQLQGYSESSRVSPTEKSQVLPSILDKVPAKRPKGTGLPTTAEKVGESFFAVRKRSAEAYAWRRLKQALASPKSQPKQYLALVSDSR